MILVQRVPQYLEKSPCGGNEVSSLDTLPTVQLLGYTRTIVSMAFQSVDSKLL